MIHLDRIEGTEFCAQTAIHTDINIDVKFCRFRNWTSCFGICRAFDPYALGWAYFGTNSTGCTALFVIAFFIYLVDQKRNKSELLRNWQFFFRILYGENTFASLLIRCGMPASVP